MKKMKQKTKNDIKAAAIVVGMVAGVTVGSIASIKLINSYYEPRIDNFMLLYTLQIVQDKNPEAFSEAVTQAAATIVDTLTPITSKDPLAMYNSALSGLTVVEKVSEVAA